VSIANRPHNVVVVDFGPSELLVEGELDGEKAVVGPFGDGMEGHGRVPLRGVISTGMAGGEAIPMQYLWLCLRNTKRNF